MSRTCWHRMGVSSWFALAVLLATRLLWAADDGGGRSVFARGAGNRALAMGGAYVAVADDASAVLWNPGGLGWVERNEFQVTHTNLIGLGFSEQYGSLVMPHWRWGTACLSFRKFGADGIEQRDPRNILLDDDLTDSETEIALSYGRKVGAAFSIGGAVKLRRQSLAGYSDSGLGFDLGFLVRPLQVAKIAAPWAERLTAGLALRNAVEPAIRLDQESVPDPRGVRTGLAYAHPLGVGRGLLVSVDVEKTNDMATRLHAGVELTLQSLLALRAGSNAGTLTAGVGVRWQEFGVDYMFEDVPYQAVHRIGLSIGFGPTVHESRSAAFAAEQERLEIRLAEAFEKQNRHRIQELIDQSETALARRQFDTALQILATVDVLEPENDRARSLTATTLREKGLQMAAAGDYSEAAIVLGRALTLSPEDKLAARGLALVREELDKKAEQSAELRRLFNQALDAFAAEDLESARTGFARVLAVDPDDSEAAAMLRRIEESISHRTANLLVQARTLLAAGRLPDAEAALKQIRKLNPDAAELSELEEAVARANQRQQALQQSVTADAGTEPQPADSGEPKARPGSTVRLSEQKQREITELYRLGMAARQEGRVADAIHYWELVWSSQPGHERVSEYLKHEYLTRGMEAFVSGELEAAVQDWEGALRVDPDDERAKGYLERARGQLARMQKISGATE